MTDSRPLLRHPTLLVTMEPIGRDSWIARYGACTPQAFTLWLRRNPPPMPEAGRYEIEFTDHLGTFTVVGTEHADDETAWDQLMDALAARMPDFHRRVRHAEQTAEDAERARKNAEEEMPI